ncbi:MAG TPA: twin-arginine translocase subunit TatC [Solirubrobacteraceae bacterium]|jgi:sec-independent protein translocase protein TatC
MATAIRTIGHEDRLSLVDHLEELRTRLIVCVLALAIAFGLCLWQNHTLLEVINRPEIAQTKKQVAKGEGLLGQTTLAQRGVLELAHETQSLVGVLSGSGSGLSPAARGALQRIQPRLRALEARVPHTQAADKLVALGIGESFTTTIAVALGFALILALPVMLFELYGFLLPAFSPGERRVATPLLAAVPLLFLVGVLFGYFVVLPASLRFLVNFNSSEFNILVQANQYYRFAATILLAMGLVFQVPVAILGATRAGIVTVAQLRKNRRYALLVCAAVAAFLPGDAITLLLETGPLYLLYELSVLIASLAARRDRNRPQPASPAEQPRPSPTGSAVTDGREDMSVEQIIDHVDRDLSD